MALGIPLDSTDLAESIPSPPRWQSIDPE
jgi:hypothetical protein